MFIYTLIFLIYISIASLLLSDVKLHIFSTGIICMFCKELYIWKDYLIRKIFSHGGTPLDPPLFYHQQIIFRRVMNVLLTKCY